MTTENLKSRHDQPTKKVKHYFPVYCFVVPILQAAARPLGYAITVHGSGDNDLDLVAIPWVEDAVSPEELITALSLSCTAFYKRDKKGNMVANDSNGFALLDWDDKGIKPHGRIAYNIQLGAGARIDVSIMPRIMKEQDDDTV